MNVQAEAARLVLENAEEIIRRYEAGECIPKLIIEYGMDLYSELGVRRTSYGDCSSAIRNELHKLLA